MSAEQSSPSPERTLTGVTYFLPGTPICSLWTSSAEGDLAASHVPDEERRARHRRLVSRPWSGARQVHGSSVVRIDQPGQQAGEADALVSERGDVALSMLGADCATIAIASPEGILAAVHAGWRGVVAGVVPAATDAMRSMGATSLVAGVGPCLGPCCAEFSPRDLDAVASVVGDVARSTDSMGRPALDLPSSVISLLEACGVDVVVGPGECTRCSGGYFSHRGGSSARQAVVVWRP